MIRDFKKGEDYFIGNESVEVDPIIEKKDKKCKCPRKLLFGEQIQILEDSREEKNHLKLSYNFEGKKCEGHIKFDRNKDLKLTRDRALEIYFLDVGQGDSILIVTPQNKKILIDGGPDDSAYNLLRRKYSLSKNKNIEFEAIYLTHGDEDHATGLIPILESNNIKINKLYHNGIMKYDTDTKKEVSTGIGPKVMVGSDEYHLKGIKDDLFELDREIALSARSRKLLDPITYGLREYKSDIKKGKFKIKGKIRAVLKKTVKRDSMSPIVSDDEKKRVERLDSMSGVKYQETISIKRPDKVGKIYPTEQELKISILGPIRPIG